MYEICLNIGLNIRMEDFAWLLDNRTAVLLMLLAFPASLSLVFRPSDRRERVLLAAWMVSVLFLFQASLWNLEFLQAASFLFCFYWNDIRTFWFSGWWALWLVFLFPVFPIQILSGFRLISLLLFFAVVLVMVLRHQIGSADGWFLAGMFLFLGYERSLFSLMLAVCFGLLYWAFFIHPARIQYGKETNDKAEAVQESLEAGSEKDSGPLIPFVSCLSLAALFSLRYGFTFISILMKSVTFLMG